MKQAFAILSALFATTLNAAPLVTSNSTSVADDQDYYTFDTDKARIIFTEQNKQAAQRAAALQSYLADVYSQSFGYQMDTRLNLGLMSSYNQIANGFASQFPLNRQINYLGGAQRIDYFSSTSWLDTLLLHETAHNYQTNVKDNPVSQDLYKLIRNGSFLFPLIPAIHPNIYESSFMLEGNAVLNESWHGNGGRLYNGRYRAMTYAHAKAGKLTRERLYNTTLNFPYAEGFYIFGSQYQYYLAHKYGLDEVNRYFKNRSRHWYWPFLTNRPMQNTLGINFNQSFSEWEKLMRRQAQQMQTTKGEIITTSKFFSQMNRQNDEIYFLTNPDAVSAPRLNQFNTKSHTLSSQASSLSTGKIFNLDGKVYSVSARRTSVWRTYQGLFDNNGYIKPDTQGKIIQGYLSDDSPVYFDAAKSFDQPQLYIGDSFYAQVNSSVLVKNDHLYYFVQNGDTRILFRDKQAIARFKGYYGIIADVDTHGRVYFIANSEYGSSLYRVQLNKFERVLAADNILDAKLAGNKILVTAVSEDHYYMSLETPEISHQSPYQIRLLWDKNPHAIPSPPSAVDNQPQQKPTPKNHYSLLNNLGYSAGHFALGSVVKENEDGEQVAKTLYRLSAQFADPLDRTRIALWSMRDNELSNLVGVSISNNQSFVLAGLNAFYVTKSGLEQIEGVNTRDIGLAAQLRFPFVQTGFWRAELDANYYQDYKLNEREPFSFALNVNRTEQFANSWLANNAVAFSVYGVEDRNSQISGASFSLTSDFPAEFYLQASAKYSQSNLNQVDPLNRKGVELQTDNDLVNNDPSKFILSSLFNDVFAKSVSYGAISISKVLNLSAYSFKLPLSLRREKLLLAFRHYQIEQPNNAGDETIQQIVAGIDMDLLLLHKVPFNFGLHYIYSDNDDLTEKNQFQFGVNLPF